MAENQKTPWKRLTIEATAIVGSILLAFAIDAWWEARQDRHEEQQILQGLFAEFEENRTILQRHRARHLQEIQSLERLLNAIAHGRDDNTDATIDTALDGLLAPSTTDLGNGVLDALLSSGRIEILTNRVLRARLAAWHGVIGEVWDDQANNASMVFDLFVPYVVRNDVSPSAPMSKWYKDWTVPVRSVSDDPDAVARLLQDSEFRVLIELRYGFKRHLTEEFETALVAVEEILEEIDRSLMQATPRRPE